MWPWGHLAVGYLCYVAILHIWDRDDQSLLTLTALAVGTQFPDLVDKPLAWTFTLLPSGRSLAHSLLVAVIIISILAYIGQRRRQLSAVFAFAIGYLTHVFADLGPEVVWGLLQGDWSQLEWTTYLLWPVLAPPEYPSDESFLAHFAKLDLEAYVIFQFVLLGIAILVWVVSGQPGLASLRTEFKRKAARLR